MLSLCGVVADAFLQSCCSVAAQLLRLHFSCVAAAKLRFFCRVADASMGLVPKVPLLVLHLLRLCCCCCCCCCSPYCYYNSSQEEV
jgi:hypothetical protein